MFRTRIPNGVQFKVITPRAERGKLSKKLVPNDKAYTKMGQSHAVEILGGKVAIFDRETMCKPYPRHMTGVSA